MAQAPLVTRASEAFALWISGGSVVTWGNPKGGGDSSAVQDQLRHVRKICAADHAFAAVLNDGRVVTWGDPTCGGDSSGVQNRLRNVQEIHATSRAFAAVLGDGSVVTWGDPQCGGDSSEVKDRLKNVKKICQTARSFAALLDDRSVATWGCQIHGGDSSRVQEHLRNVQCIFAEISGSFHALTDSEEDITWGRGQWHRLTTARSDLRIAQDLQTNALISVVAFADGAFVTTAGLSTDDSSVQEFKLMARIVHLQQELKVKLCMLCMNLTRGEAELLHLCWLPYKGNGRTGVWDRLKNVQMIRFTQTAFAAVLADGTVETWGSRRHGGNCRTVETRLIDVQDISATFGAFAARLGSGRVVTWGDPTCGGDSSGVQNRLRNVQEIHATSCAFAAVLGDGSVVTWGDPQCGGDARKVQEELQWLS